MEEARLEAANGGSNVRLMEDQRNAEADVLRIKTEIATHDQQNKDDQAACQVAKQNLEQANRSVQAKKTEINNKQNSLRQISAAEGDFLKVFGARLPALLKTINNERGFRVKPVGPIGTYITLRDPKWLSILERFFGGTLLAFVVTNYEDSELLKRLMKSCNWYARHTLAAFPPNPLLIPRKRTPITHYSDKKSVAHRARSSFQYNLQEHRGRIAYLFLPNSDH